MQGKVPLTEESGYDVILDVFFNCNFREFFSQNFRLNFQI